jgi:hypothetical protein
LPKTGAGPGCRQFGIQPVGRRHDYHFSRLGCLNQKWGGSIANQTLDLARDFFYHVRSYTLFDLPDIRP